MQDPGAPRDQRPTHRSACDWYHFTIDGDIVSSQVHYLDFIVGTTSHSLTQYSFNPTGGTGDFLVAAMQLDGDSAADPYLARAINDASRYTSTDPAKPKRG